MSVSEPQTSHPLLQALGHRVRRLRTRRGWSLRELAEAADLSTRFVASIEAGQANVSVLKLARLAGALEVESAELLEPETRPGVIALLGLRGAGKSTIGPRLADALDLPFFELDALVEEAAGLSLSEIFALHGEAYYRDLERQTLRSFFAEHDAAVLATGGGIVTDPETLELLRRHARLVWLRARPEDHWQRVIQQGDRRPMADNPQAMSELRALLAEREPAYRQAEITVDTSALGVDGSVQALGERLQRGSSG